MKVEIGPEAMVVLTNDGARAVFDQLREHFGGDPPPAAPTIFADDHPIWRRHSGGARHAGPEWRYPDDLPRAQAAYAQFPAKTRVFVDLLADRGGQMVTAEELVAAAPETFTSMYAVAACINGLRLPCEEADRRFPFCWWRGAAGSTRYAMKPSVARLFREARGDQ